MPRTTASDVRRCSDVRRRNGQPIPRAEAHCSTGILAQQNERPALHLRPSPTGLPNKQGRLADAGLAGQQRLCDRKGDETAAEHRASSDTPQARRGASERVAGRRCPGWSAPHRRSGHPGGHRVTGPGCSTRPCPTRHRRGQRPSHLGCSPPQASHVDEHAFGSWAKPYTRHRTRSRKRPRSVTAPFWSLNAPRGTRESSASSAANGTGQPMNVAVSPSFMHRGDVAHEVGGPVDVRGSRAVAVRSIIDPARIPLLRRPDTACRPPTVRSRSRSTGTAQPSTRRHRTMTKRRGISLSTSSGWKPRRPARSARRVSVPAIDHALQT